MRKTKYDWVLIQKDYDDGYSYDGLISKYHMAIASIVKAKNRGVLKTRSKSDAQILSHKLKPRKHSNDTKLKISISRIKYLNENPDKVPYKLNHSSKMSYPEKLFQDALIRNNINGWKYNYQFGIYCFDFAFPEIKIDVEIDGGTHLSEKVIRIDKRRDENSIKNGWKIIRFTANDVKNNINQCIDKLKKYIPL